MTIPDLLLLVGDSNSGKTYSLRNLDPTKTHIVQCSPAPKLLGWMGSNKYKYKENLFHEPQLVSAFHKIKEIVADKHDIVVDDVYYLAYTRYTVLSEKVDQIKNEKDKTNANFAAYRTVGREQYAVIRALECIQPGAKGVVIMHDELYQRRIIARQVGTMSYRDAKPEEQFSIVLYSERFMVDGEIRYVFLTRDDGITPAKSPPEMFPRIIPNDMQLVYDRIDEFKQEVYLKDSKLDFGEYDMSEYFDKLQLKAETVMVQQGSLRMPVKERIDLKKNRR